MTDAPDTPGPDRRGSATAAGPEPRAERRAWIGLAVLALPTLLLSLDISVLYLALPHLSADLDADSGQQFRPPLGWI